METKYLKFSVIEKKVKTKVYGIFSKSSGDKLGTVKWYASWRQYCFFPTISFVTIWNKDCIMDIYNFMYDLNKNHKELEKEVEERLNPKLFLKLK